MRFWAGLGIYWSVLPILRTTVLGKLLTQQVGAYAFVAVALPLTLAHPLIHHLESGTLDAVIDYVYAATINAMNYGEHK